MKAEQRKSFFRINTIFSNINSKYVYLKKVTNFKKYFFKFRVNCLDFITYVLHSNLFNIEIEGKKLREKCIKIHEKINITCNS